MTSRLQMVVIHNTSKFSRKFMFSDTGCQKVQLSGISLTPCRSIAPILGRTVEEAQAKYERYKQYIDYRGGLAKISGYIGVDLSSYPLDEPFKFDMSKKGESGIQAIMNMLKNFDGQDVTPRMLGEKMAFFGFGPMPVGTPEMVADCIEEWATVGDVDGFNVCCK